ncbi:neuroparsin-A-like [Pseudomyrmex gracilis]|uniref:neuroparsin-A-like n=1 Tax=Pseudomyrmex gracilis TaxID=219809 RepID=UPI00099586C0|nr:neuroparsin-A-like [Pseudomyrmex gracilis]
MLNIQVFYAFTLLTAIFFVGKCHPLLRRQDVRPLCLGCGNECDKCEFGYTISTLCGIRECRRGPGQICGGPSETWGVCGEGLRCSCNRCSGCSLDSLTCFENPCLPHLESRSHLEPSLDGFPFERVAK